MKRILKLLVGTLLLFGVAVLIAGALLPKGYRVERSIDFGDMGTATADWSFTTTQNGTKVTWGILGVNERMLGGIFSKMMDGWIGPYYEDGLQRLKTVAETTNTLD